MHTYINYTNKQAHILTLSNIQTRIHTVYTFAYIHAFIYTYIHSCTHTYTQYL